MVRLRDYWRRGLIDDGVAKETLAAYGLSDYWIDVEMDSWKALPYVDQLKTYYLRQFISEDVVKYYLKKFGYIDDHIEWEISSWWIIPDVSDLITFYKLNLINKDELYNYLKTHGINDPFLDMYEYTAWELPSFIDVFAAYIRGAIDENDFNTWLSILNIKTEPRPGMTKPDIDVFKEGVYRMPSPFYLVYAAETGALSVDDLKNILRDSLYHPKYIDMLASSIWKRSLLDDIREATRAIIRDFLDWILSYDEAVEALRSIGRRDEEIEIFMPFYSSLQMKKMRSKVLSEYEKMYRKGYITKDQFIEKLVNSGFNQELVQMYANLLEEIRNLYDMIKETMDERRALATTLQKLYKLGFLSEDDLRSKLHELGFMDSEIELRVERSKQEYSTEITLSLIHI